MNFLFPASHLPATTDPDRLSEDVSLVQQYDGSGWGFPEDPTNWNTVVLSAAGVDVDTVLVTVPRGFVYRLFAAHVFTLIAPPPVSQLLVGTIGASQTFVALTNRLLVPGVGLGNISFSLHGLNRPIVIGPGMELQGSHFSGGAATVLSYSTYGCLAPLGTVFAC